MTDSIQIKLTGDTDVRAAFKELRDDLPKNFLRTAVKNAADLLNGFIVLVAPFLTGRLRRNIVVKTHATPSTIRARVVVNTQGKAGSANNAFYWRFLEKGFHDRGGNFRIFSFVKGIFDAKNREAAQLVIDSVGKAIDKAEAKARR